MNDNLTDSDKALIVKFLLSKCASPLIPDFKKIVDYVDCSHPDIQEYIKGIKSENEAKLQRLDEEKARQQESLRSQIDQVDELINKLKEGSTDDPGTSTPVDKGSP